MMSQILITVYPRAYGEHRMMAAENGSQCGLSPCIRGTLNDVKNNPTRLRFIPVHTGNTSGSSQRISRGAVYPRAYGEHLESHNMQLLTAGLSPCIRGTLRINPARLKRLRFIPVHTGNTLIIID